MPLVQPGVVITIDGDGRLAEWVGGSFWAGVGDPRLPPERIYFGQKELIEVQSVIHDASGQVEFSSILDKAISRISDAQVVSRIQLDGDRVDSITTLTILARASDDWSAYLVPVAKHLRSYCSRAFPGKTFHIAAIILLPNLFNDADRIDYAKAYGLLKKLEGYQQEPSPFKIFNVPTKLFDSIWLANSANEHALTVGRFPEATHALTVFVDGLYSGHIDKDMSAFAFEVHGRKPAFCSFGCSSLEADRETLLQLLAHDLEKQILPPAFLNVSTAPVAHLESVQFLQTSPLKTLKETVCDSPWEDKRHHWPNEHAMQEARVDEDLKLRKDAVEGGLASAYCQKMVGRVGQLKDSYSEEVRVAASRLADKVSVREAISFLKELSDDPVDLTILSATGQQISLFSLIGKAIRDYDALAIYDGAKARLAKAEKKIADIRDQKLATERERDRLQELVLSKQVDQATSAPSPDGDPEKLREKLQATLALVHSLETAISEAQAAYRGVLLSEHSFRADERLQAIKEEVNRRDLQAVELKKLHNAAIVAVRRVESEIAELLALRRAWTFRQVFINPMVAIGIFLVLHLAAMALGVEFQAIARFYGNNVIPLLKFAGFSLLLYGGVRCFQYWTKFFLPERELLKVLAEKTNAAASAAAERGRCLEAILKYPIELQKAEAVIAVLSEVRRRCRDFLLKASAFLTRIQQRVDSARPVIREDTLYRMRPWNPEDIDTVYAALTAESQIIKEFLAVSGNRSTWMLDDESQTQDRLNKFAVQVFADVTTATVEDFLFNERFGIQQNESRNRVAAFSEAATPYLKLEPTLLQGSTTHTILLARGGSQSRVATVFDTLGMECEFPQFEEPDKVTLLRIRKGFAACSLVEVKNYWHDYLRNAGVYTGADSMELAFLELLPGHLIPDYELAARSFLVLLIANRIDVVGESYFLDEQTALGKDRMAIYARLVDDSNWPLRDQVLAEAEKYDHVLSESTLKANPILATLNSWERAIVLSRQSALAAGI